MTVKFGCIGDSGLDSYRGDDNRGGAYAAYSFAPPEILVRLRGWDLGAWGSYGEPRRTDYANNWARHAANTSDAISTGQHTGLAAQVAGGSVDYCLVAIGANDFSPINASVSIYDEIYANTLSGGSLTTALNNIAGRIATILDALLAEEPSGVVCQTIPYWPDVNLIAAGFTNATGRQRCRDAMTTTNELLADVCSARSVPLVERGLEPIEGRLLLSGSYSSRTFEYWGETINYDANDDEPHNFLLDESDGHMGTIANAIVANMSIIEPLNAAYGLGIRPLQPWEVLELAGIATSVRGSVTRVA